MNGIKVCIIVLLANVCMFFDGCNREEKVPPSVPTVPEQTATTDTLVQIDTVPSTPELTPIEESHSRENVNQKTGTSETKKVGTQKPSGSEKLYVKGYDSKGAVWGYVTMNGNRGKGTIHDAEENHYAVTCERKGDELFAIDQNGRQYVLKF